MKPLLAALFLLLALLPGPVPAQYVRRGPRAAGSNKGAPSAAIPPVEMRGKLREIDKKTIVIDAGEDQTLTFKRSKKTKFLKGEKEIQPDDFPDGAKVTVEANRAPNGDYDAVDVFLGEPPGAPGAIIGRIKPGASGHVGKPGARGVREATPVI